MLARRAEADCRGGHGPITAHTCGRVWDYVGAAAGALKSAQFGDSAAGTVESPYSTAQCLQDLHTIPIQVDNLLPGVLQAGSIQHQ